MNTVAKVFDDHGREAYIDAQLRGADCRSAWVRDDARQLAQYVKTLIATPSVDTDKRDQVRGSIHAARMALTEALLAVEAAQEEYDAACKPKMIRAAE